MKLLSYLSKNMKSLLFCVIFFCLAFIFIVIGYSGQEGIDKKAIYLSIGTSLLVAGIVTAFNQLKELAQSKIIKSIKNVIFNAGVEDVFPKRDLDKYDKLMHNLSESLDIVGYTINAFYESYSDILLAKVKSNPNLSVRILVVDPESPFSKNRAEQEGKSIDSIRDSINRLKDKLGSISNIRCKGIKAPLTTMIFRIDKTLFVGPHLYKKPSKATLTMELNEGGWLYEIYRKEFEDLWSDGEAL